MNGFDLSDIERNACRVVAAHSTEPIRTPQDQELEFARQNDVLAHYGHALYRGSGNVADVAHDDTRSRISSYLECLDSVATDFADEHIQLVALKNTGIARGILPCAGCCPMGDVDVLVRKRDFRKAHRIMLEHDFHFEFRSPLEDAELRAAEEGGGAEYWKMLPNGKKLWFELQWRPVAGRWIRPDQEPSAAELMDRSVPIHGTTVRLLAPEDNLLQVALHTAKHTYVRAPGFRLHTDVDRIVHMQRIDWDVFLSRVRRLNVATAVYFSLAIPAAIFNTAIPDRVLDQLRPPPWKETVMLRWINHAGLFNPSQKKFGKLQYIAFTALLEVDPIFRTKIGRC